MTEAKDPMNSGEEKKEGISIESQKVIQGMSLVFTGALTMLEAIHPRVSIEPKALLHLLTGNVDRLCAFAEEKSATTEKLSVDESEKAATATAVDGTVDAAPAAVANEDAGGTDTEEMESQKTDESPAPTLTQDDITKIIVQKIKQNRANNEKIGQILKSYGVAKVSELPAYKYESFVTDLSAI